MAIKNNNHLNVFISYRRQDSAAIAGRIHDRLIELFPKLKIFMDVETIAGGDDFSKSIFSALEQSDIFICLIGEQWAINQAGENRLKQPVDYVREEVIAGLKANCKVYPILINDCKMPDESILPEELKPLCSLNAFELRNSRFSDDFFYIIESIFSIKRSQIENKILPRILKSILLGIPSGLVFLFFAAQLNYWLSGKSLALTLGEGLTTLSLILSPLIACGLFYRKYS